jgi:hypothetical protein
VQRDSAQAEKIREAGFPTFFARNLGLVFEQTPIESLTQYAAGPEK